MIPPNANGCVVLTPPGAGAIGIVRIMGPNAISTVERLFRPKGKLSLVETPPGQVRFGRLSDGEEPIDDVLVIRGGAPARSAHQTPPDPTSSDPVFVDICAHGGVRVIERILEALATLGMPLIEQSEIVPTLWPVGTPIDREAFVVLTRSKTERAVRFLCWQRQNLPRAIEEIAQLCLTDRTAARDELENLCAGYRAAKTLLEGASVVLIGPPNSGKSTLFNRFLGRTSTIVSPHPGTTRDWVCETTEVEGVPTTFYDTAGIHSATASLEQEAIAAGRQILQGADVLLVVLDGSIALPANGLDLSAPSDKDRPTQVAINKVDLPQKWNRGMLPWPEATDAVAISATTGAGVDELRKRIMRLLGLSSQIDSVPGLFTRRQLQTVRKAICELDRRPESAHKYLLAHLIGA